MNSLVVAGAIASALLTPATGVRTVSQPAPGVVIAAPSSPARTASDAAPRTLGAATSLRPTGDMQGPLMQAAHNVMSRTTDDSVSASIVGGLRIRGLSEGATSVTLEDGTVWKIALADRPQVDAWHTGDHVLVTLAPIVEHGRFRYRLVDGRAGTEALAAFAGSGGD